tara:strand:+ start:18 stop:476 length:459 start_codon:yes stop_codon:yes gene_type:complete
MSKLSVLQEYKNPIFIARHSEGEVHKISDKYVVKVPVYGNNEYKNLMYHEINIARLLFSLGFPVPEPITIDYVNVRGEIELGYIMEYIEGISIYDKNISIEDKVVAKNLLHRETKKLFKKGFTSKIGAVECILTPNEEIRLIDFSSFTYKDL